MFISKNVYAAEFTANPKTEYSKDFIGRAENQQWFLDAVEKILLAQGKSINNLESKEDLKNIFSLGVQNKNIEGKIPKAIGELSSLRYLYLSKNKLTGTIPNELYNLRNLENLDISENQLSGDLSSNIQNLTNLRVLLMWGNELSGNIPNEIINLNQLENLDLSHNNFTGVIPNFSELKHLMILALSNNELTGTIPAGLSDSSELKTVLLWHNKLTGEIPEEFKNLSQMVNFDISENKITGTVSDKFEEMPKLELLDISSNLFVGDIGENIFQKSKDFLKLHADGNYMAGTNLADISNNKDNFIDEKPEQNRFKIKEEMRISIGTKIDVFKDLKIVSPEDGSITREKLELDHKYFEARVLSTDEKLLKRIEISRDSSGKLIIKPIGVISASENAMVEIYIKEDDGFEYPAMKFKLISYQNSNNSGQGYNTLTSSDEPEEENPTEEPAEIPSEKIPTENIVLTKFKYINGYEDKIFKPNGNISREEMAHIIYSIIKDNSITSYKNKYNDLDSSRWSYEAICFVSDKGIMTGYPDGSFKLRNNLTRAEFSVIISKLKNRPVDYP